MLTKVHLLPWLIWRFAIVEHSAALTIWLAYVIAAIAISLVLVLVSLVVLVALRDRWWRSA